VLAGFGCLCLLVIFTVGVSHSAAIADGLQEELLILNLGLQKAHMHNRSVAMCAYNEESLKMAWTQVRFLYR
jgi:hypothetical protein